MIRELVFLPETAHDFIEGFDYYEALSPGRGGERFEAAFNHALQEIKTGTITHFQPFKHFHRVCLRRFPYNLYYRILGNKAVIVGLLYSRFEPRKIHEILGKRKTG